MAHHTYTLGLSRVCSRSSYGFSVPHSRTLCFELNYLILFQCTYHSFNTLSFLSHVHDDYLMVGYVLRVEALSDNNGLADT